MKRILPFSFLLMLFALVFQGAHAFVTPMAVPAEKESVITPAPSPFAGMSIQDFVTMSPKKYAELTGKKLSLSQKISLKIAQAKVKKAMKKNKDIQLMNYTQGIDTSDFSIGGFVLGLLLGVIGVLIAYLIGDQAVIKWSWYGFAVWGIIVLLALIL